MLKRPRVPSPSPTRADPSSPPFDDHPCLPLPKRRRTVGPSVDSFERRGVAEDDGEDDENDDYDDTNLIFTPDGKVYEHMNHFLHCLHTETQHRSQSTQLHPRSSFTHPNSHITDPSTLVSPRDPLSLGSLSPSSSQVKSFQGHQSFSNLTSTRGNERMMPQEVEESIFGCCDPLHGMTRAIPNKTELGWGDERVRVTQRYEDTNRLLGSLVLSRRRMLPSVDSE